MGDYTESAADRGNRGPQVIRSSQSIDYVLQPSMVEGAAIPEQGLAQTLPDLLYTAASSIDPATGVLSIQADGSEQFYSYAELLDRAQRILTGLRRLGLQPHEPVILQLPQPLEFLAGFWGCVLGGLVPVPIAVAPSYTADHSKANALRAGMQVLERATVLTTPALQGAIAEFLQADRPEAEQSQIVTIDSLLQNGPDRDAHQAALDDLALILLTSGSTGQPKGVMLSARNILASTYGMATVNGLSSQSVLLNWMPLEHVASLVMFHLTPVFLGCQQLHAPIDRILQEPLHWLDLLDRYRVTATWAPNFAYGLVIDRAEAMASRQWDLSSIEWMGNGAEAVVGKTTRQFLTLLEPHGLRSTAVSPGYGMSETCSGIMHSHNFSLATTSDADAFVEVGTPIPGVAVRIVDEQQHPVAEGTVGLLQVRGATVTAGYYGRPELNTELFTADGWLNTGDLGFVRQGRLTITGRQKDVIVINGVNYYNHEIEAIVEELEGVESSYTAACAVRQPQDATDRLAIFFSPALSEQEIAALIGLIRGQVVHQLGISPDYVIPLEPSQIPKTAIGKIQRSRLSQQFQAGEFAAVLSQVTALLQGRSARSRQPQTALEQQLVEIWQAVLGLEAVGIQENFFELGGNSLRLMQVLHQLQQAGHSLLAVDLFQHPTIETLSAHLTQARSATPSRSPQPLALSRPRPTTSPEIAVIGMAGRFPGADSIEQFWQNLCDGVESITFFSDEEILDSGVDPALLHHTDYVKASPILTNVDQFDAEFFGYSAKEAEWMDPQQRLLLECAWESLEDAGYNPFTYAGAIGLYAGAAMNTYLLNHVYPNRHRLDDRDRLDVVTLSSMGGLQLSIGNDKDYLTTRVSYKLNLTGPSVNVQTACSTSLVAIHLAAQSLRQGECDMALAGGVSVHVPQQVGHLYQPGMILSPDGHCRAFDAQAQGTIFGSGVGLVVLKPLEQAIADGDRIYAVIKGSAIGNDGSTKVGYLAPRAEGQATVAAAAMAMDAIDPATVTYVEAHGTGTELGDPIELAGLTQAFRTGTQQRQFCAIGSVKTNVGHLNVASGVAGFIKAVLALHHKQLPPSLHFSTPNPQLNLEHSPFYVNTTLADWTTNGHPRRAGVNSLGIGGTNAHVLLEEAPAQKTEISGPQEPRSQLLALSAKSEAALRQLAKHYERFLAAHRTVSLEDLCFTANTGRAQFDYRWAAVAESVESLRQQLATFSADSRPLLPVRTPRLKLAFLFTGQGAQYAKMGRDLYNTEAVFRATIDRCAAILQAAGDSPAGKTGYDSLIQASRLDQTAYTQPALFAIGYALAALWRSWGVEPAVVMGHSVGEYVAACVAGVFSLEDGLRLVADRGRLMQTLPGGSMVALLANQAVVADAIAPYGKDVAIAAINGAENTVIAGRTEVLQPIVAELTMQGVKARWLNVSHAFHSPLMQPMIAAFAPIAQTITYTLPRINLISNLTGQITDTVATPDYWVRHTHQPVQFAAGLATLQQLNCDAVIECGPKPVLLGMAQLHLAATQQLDPNHLWLPSLHPDRPEQLWHSLKALHEHGAAIDWEAVSRAGDRSTARQRLSLPTYPFQRQRYWLEAPSPVRARPPSPALHPLLGQRLPTALKAVVFQSSLSLSTPAWLGDHRVGNRAIVPATAYLEMGLAAGKAVLKTTAIGLEQVSIQQPLWLSPSDQTLQVIVTPEGRGATFEIYSAAPNHENWTRHAAGTIVRQDATLSSTLDLMALQHSLTEPRSSPAHYQRCQVLGIDYGASFQGVKRLWREDGEALAEVELPSVLASEATAYALHPALLDACFQGVLAALPAAQPDRYLPVGLEQFQLCPSSATVSWSHVRLRSIAEPHAATVTADVTLFTRQGAVLGEVRGLTAQRIGSAAVPQTPERSGSDWLYRVDWQPAQLDQPHRDRAHPGTWLILDNDTTGLASALQTRLEAQQQSCLRVIAGAEFQQTDRQFTLDPTQPNDFHRLLQTVADSLDSDRPLRGVIHSWSLDSENFAEKTSHDLPSLSASVERSCQSALYLAQALSKVNLSVPPRLWLVTRGAQVVGKTDRPWAGLGQSPLWGLGRTIALEHPEWHCTLVDLDPQADSNHQLDQWTDELTTELGEARDYQIAFRQGGRYVPRLVPHPASSFWEQSEPIDSQISQTTSQPESQTNSLRLEIADRGTLESLVWRSVPRRSPQQDEVEIRVHASGLNFRDLLNALDLYPGEAGALGLECAGEIVAIGPGVTSVALGDAVMAIAAGSFSQYVTVAANQVVPIPTGMSMAAAATVPTTFLTASYTLQHLANLAPGDRVLIHAAAGGVGLAAVQIAQQVGAEIFATASPGKWAALQALGVRHVMNSRSLDFAEAVMAATQGQGVDVVLNCLSGEFIAKSLAVLSPQGRFVEIGKQAVWSPAEVAAVRPDVSYVQVDLMQITQQQPSLIQALLRDLMSQLQMRRLQPLPLTSFPSHEAIAAFRTMQQAKHIGKIVLTLPPQPVDLRSDATYLITGGLGDLGLQVAQSLAASGVKHLLLLGRRAPSPTAEATIEQLQAAGITVTVAQADVTHLEEMRQVLQPYLQPAPTASVPPLKGVIHAAGLIDDGVLQQQTWQQFDRVLAPKIQGAWTLHCLTQQLPLDFFVLFSSAASLLGAAGQANYAAANAFLEALALARRSSGLPGLSINWGAWSQVGLAARLPIAPRTALPGLGAIAPSQGLEILQSLVRTSPLVAAQVAVLPLDRSVKSFPRDVPPALIAFLSAVLVASVPPVESLRHRLETASGGDRRRLLSEHVRAQVAKILGVEPSLLTQPQQGLLELGMDSLTSVELRNRLQTSLGCTLPSTLLFDYPTLESLIDYLAATLGRAAERSSFQPATDSLGDLSPNPERSDPDWDKIEQLSEEEAEAWLLSELERLNY